jgi:hypothetical protein
VRMDKKGARVLHRENIRPQPVTSWVVPVIHMLSPPLLQWMATFTVVLNRPRWAEGRQMRGFWIRPAPAEVLGADVARFDDGVIGAMVQSSGLALDYAIVRRYCRWFIGSDWGWKWQRGEYWGEGFPRQLAGSTGEHLAGQYFPGVPRFSLHMKCKAERHQEKPFYWTPYLGIDIDNRPGQKTEVGERYTRCIEVLGCQPVVVRSPRHGLHVFVPLHQPVSVFGFLYTLKEDREALIPSALREAGVEVRPGSVETLPTHTHTFRLPLAPGTVQLDPGTLRPLPTLGRPDEIARLVESMDQIATTAPLDATALASEFGHHTRNRRVVKAVRPPRAMTTTSGTITTITCPKGGTGADVEWLELHGLYEGVCRNEAAMALARQKKLVEGWSTERTVDFLTEWTVTKINGRSKTVGSGNNTATLQTEYERICNGIDRGIASGKVIAKISRGAGQAITRREADWILAASTAAGSQEARYRAEVFLFCMTGFAKDRGTRVEGPGRNTGAVVVQAQLPATTMQRWPGGSAGGYKQLLTWALESGFTRVTRNYRNSQNPVLCRARTYELEIEASGGTTLNLESFALLETAERLSVRGRLRIHPRQVEHAQHALWRFPTAFTERYGKQPGNLIEELGQLYEEVTLAAAQPIGRVA